MAELVSTQGFVLAGGRSVRMGRDKADLEWHGRTLLEHMVTLLSCVTDRVQVVGRPPLNDLVPGRGPLGGIATALEVSDLDANLVVAVDLPFLTPEFLNYFKNRYQKSSEPALACSIGGRYPLCLWMKKSVLTEVHRRLDAGELSVHGLLNACGTDWITETELSSAGFSPMLFKNLNTPADLESL
jgi:molybdopterin-guanine dinucleotide biosynthesis protein A